MASGDILAAYGSSTTLAITLASLASSSIAGRESATVTTTVNKPLDVHVMLQTKTSSGTIANDKAIYIYVHGSEDGTNYGSANDVELTGTDAAVTNVGTGLILASVISASTSGTAYNSQPFSVAQAFGGYVPRKWGVVVRNFTGVALDSTASGVHVLSYTEIYQTVTP